jgi:hypothetical protein
MIRKNDASERVSMICPIHGDVAFETMVESIHSLLVRLLRQALTREYARAAPATVR